MKNAESGDDEVKKTEPADGSKKKRKGEDQKEADTLAKKKATPPTEKSEKKTDNQETSKADDKVGKGKTKDEKSKKKGISDEEVKPKAKADGKSSTGKDDKTKADEKVTAVEEKKAEKTTTKATATDEQKDGKKKKAKKTSSAGEEVKPKEDKSASVKAGDAKTEDKAKTKKKEDSQADEDNGKAGNKRQLDDKNQQNTKRTKATENENEKKRKALEDLKNPKNEKQIKSVAVPSNSSSSGPDGKTDSIDLSSLEKTGTLDSLDMLVTPRRALSFATEDSTPDSDGRAARIARLTVIDESTKEAILGMSKPSDLPYEERKRQYAAMRRAIVKEACPALTNKFKMASDKERFLMLKAWMANPNLGDIEIEERYKSFSEEKRKDKYVTVSILQLEKVYGKSKEAKEFISQVLKGQKGVPHPQAPNCPKARMYKVLESIAENRTEGTMKESSASVGGRVKDPESKMAIAKQMGDLGCAPLMDLETGAFKAKKAKKQKSPEDEAMSQLKAYEKKGEGHVESITSLRS